MMTANPTRLLALALLAAAAGCTGEFDELNTNPNTPTEVPPALLLRQVTFDLADELSYEGFTGGANLGQYFSAVPGFNAFDRGDLLAPQFGGNPWPALYTNLRDIRLLREQAADDPSAGIYAGPAMVLEAYVGAVLTDLFGDVPFAEAGAGRDGTYAPTYDRQADIYLGPDGLLDLLERAVAQIDAREGAGRLEGDVLYGGEPEAYARMANSLRLKLLLRSSARLDAGQLAAIEDLYAEGRYIDEAAEDATFAFGGAPNDFRFARARRGDFANYLESLTADSILTTLGDPREAVFFREAAGGGLVGVVNGLSPDAALSTDTVSLPGIIFREEADRLRANFATAWETSLVLAEAAARGYLDADARALYERGVRQAFAYWGAELPTGYLTSGPAAFDDERALEQIATQRWIANLGNGYEGWIEWRRTGHPRFYRPASSLNDGLIPIRFPYPVNEQALNADNYAEAIARIGGGNSPNAPVWWDR